MMKLQKSYIWLVLALAGVLIVGCAQKRDEIKPVEVGQLDDIDKTQFKDVDLAELAEVDLVEQLHQVRGDYQRVLQLLRLWYLENGYYEKAQWARRELKDLRLIRTYPYLTVIEPVNVPADPASKQIVEADQLYDQANKLRKQGITLPFLNDKVKLKESLELFKKLLQKYPQSTKAPDAAYYAGEILFEYLEENRQAIEYYKLALKLDPEVRRPVRFRMAAIYDYRLHDRSNALKMYQRVLAEEADLSRSNKRWASDRIKQMLKEKETN